jgi:peptide chain release factor
MTAASTVQSIHDAISKRMARLGISERDLEETFARSSGPGGQNVNKVSTAVTLRYVRDNVSVTVQDSRSQAVNRQLARERLLDKIESVIRARKQARQAEMAKHRRQTSKRPRGLKERILKSKKHRGEIKRRRGRVL